MRNNKDIFEFSVLMIQTFNKSFTGATLPLNLKVDLICNERVDYLQILIKYIFACCDEYWFLNVGKLAFIWKICEWLSEQFIFRLILVKKTENKVGIIIEEYKKLF